MQAQALLAEGGRRKADAAAWVLRRAFDRILDGRGGRRAQPAESLVEPATELPVFYYPGLSLGVGARTSFSLFEPRYVRLAEECQAGSGLLLCASAPSGGSPSSGQSAVLARLDSCTEDYQGRLVVSLVGVRTVGLGTVRESAETAGLWYSSLAGGAAEGSGARRRLGGCVIC